MQTYSTVKGKSNSDDRVSSPPPGYTIRERQTSSDDGFKSFPEYLHDEKIEDYDAQAESLPSSVTKLKILEDAQTLDDEQEEQPEGDIANMTTTIAPKKKMPRKPRKPKSQRQSRKGKAVAPDDMASIASPSASALASHTSPQTKFKPDAGPRGISFAGIQDPHKTEEMMNLWKNHPLGGLTLPGLAEPQDEKFNNYLEGKEEGKEKRTEVKIAEGKDEKEDEKGETEGDGDWDVDGEFGLSKEDLEDVGRFMKMAGEQKKKELLNLLGSLIDK
jgi:hypothetical protein